MEPPAETVLETQPVAASFAGFWSRLGALFVDGLVLGAIGFPLGLLLGERFAPVGTPGRLIGLLVVVPYFGILGSRIGRGQTLGKRVLRLRVVDADGRCLPPSRAFARAALLSLPWILNGTKFASLGPAVLAMLWIAGILIFGLGGAIIGTVVMNRPTRQGLHDLLVGSYVIEAGGLGLRVPAVSTRRPKLASAVWIGLVAAGTGAMMARGPSLMASQFPPVLFQRIAAIPGANSMQIKSITTWGAGRTSKMLVAVVWYGGQPEGARQTAREVAAAMLENHPDAASMPTLAVTVVRGWDIGIASKTVSEDFVQTPEQWRAELGL